MAERGYHFNWPVQAGLLLRFLPADSAVCAKRQGQTARLFAHTPARKH